LGAKDVFLAGASLVIGPMVIILFFLQFTTNIFTDKGKEREKLEALNNQLAENFQAEIVQALRQLKIVKKELDNQETDFLKKHDTILDLLCKDLQICGYEHGSQVIINSFWVHPFCRHNFPYFNSIFCANDQGEIGIYLSSEKEPQRINSLSHRRYVMDIIQDKGILFNGDTIAFESIRSVTDGNYELGLGIASGNNTYPTLATSFSSVSM